ncbi:MAG: hypothetical protein Q4G48_07465, partial [Bacteroidia bacterium]|nr:hypothetical protein [Bacteroidia bacterium]
TPAPPRRVSLSPYSADYYLQQLPVSPEAIQASDKIIEEGLFNIGNIAKDRLEDYDYAQEAYNRHLADFPASRNRPDVYHQLYLIYLRTGNAAMAQHFKTRILAEFPESSYAEAMSHPDYEQTMRNYAAAQDSLYQQTYRAYLAGQPKTVQDNFKKAETLFSGGNLMPKFMLLNALSMAQAGNAEDLEPALKKLTATYPDTDETAMAQRILDGISDGKTLAANASVVSGIDWKSQIVSGTENAIDTVRFDVQKNQAHSYLLLFPANSLNKNKLLFAVSDFNFSNFQLRAFSASFIRVSPFEAMQIKPFRSYDEARRYAAMIESDSVFRQNLQAEITPVIISDANLELLNSGKLLDEYLAFYNKEWEDSSIDSIPAIMPIRELQPVQEPEKIVSLDEEKTAAPVIVPQQPQRMDMEQRRAELERKAEEALQQTDNASSPRDRQRLLKERERERRALIKQRERELKERERAR